MRLTDIAEALKAEILWPQGSDETLEITGVASITSAGPGEITLLAEAKFAGQLASSGASAVVCRPGVEAGSLPRIISKDPRLSFAKIAGLFYQPDHGPKGISHRAEVDPSASLGEGLTIGPFVTVAAGARVGDGVVLYPGVYVGRDAQIGAGSVLHPNVVIGERCVVGAKNIIHAGSVLGADGFGYAVDGGRIFKIPQTGIAKTEDEVELGACCTIDRAAMEETRVGAASKFDCHVHIGHNSTVGENCLLAAGTVVAGSAEIGDWCLAGGQVAIGGHIKLGPKVSIGAKAGVIQDVEGHQQVMGFPAVPAMQWRRTRVVEKRLPEMEKTIRALERRLAELEGQLQS